MRERERAAPAREPRCNVRRRQEERSVVRGLNDCAVGFTVHTHGRTRLSSRARCARGGADHCSRATVRPAAEREGENDSGREMERGGERARARTREQERVCEFKKEQGIKRGSVCVFGCARGALAPPPPPTHTPVSLQPGSSARTSPSDTSLALSPRSLNTSMGEYQACMEGVPSIGHDIRLQEQISI